MLKLGLAAASVLVTLGLLELGLRIFAPFSVSWAQPDDTLGWSFIPNAYYRERASEGCAEWASSGRINSHGLRDYEYDYPKPAGTFRILALGDSYTEGLQHPLENIWPKLLERRLNALDDGQRYEVIDAGRSGMGTTLEYLFYVTEGYRYSADLVALLVIGNDVEDNSKALNPSTGYAPFFSLVDDDLVLNNSFRDAPDFRMRALLVPWKRRSLLVSYVLSSYRLLQEARFANSHPIAHAMAASPGAGTDPAPGYSPDIAAAIAVTRRVLLELNRATRRQGARLLLMNGSRESWDPDQPDALLSEVATANDIPYLDLTQPMERYSQETGQLMFGCKENRGQGHWSRPGHVEATELMYAFLQAHGLLARH